MYYGLLALELLLGVVAIIKVRALPRSHVRARTRARAHTRAHTKV